LSAERTAAHAVALWTSSAFVEEARAWVGEQLARRGSRLTGEWEQPHVRVWLSTIRFETTEGRAWFKVNARGTAYEAALVALLGTWRSAAAPASPSRSVKLRSRSVGDCQSRETDPTERPLILRGLISMNRFRTPSAQGTGPVSQAVVSR
jgi:hypothetical protein